MIFNSIRWRMQLWHGLILVLVLGAFGLSAYQMARKDKLRQADEEVKLCVAEAARPGLPPDRFRGAGRPEPPDGFGGGNRPEPTPDHFGEGSGPEPPGGFGGGDRPDPPPERFGGGGRGKRPPFERGFLREQISTNALRVITSKNNATPAYYFIFWKEDGTVLASSTNAPPGIPRPPPPLGARPEPGRNNWGHLGPPPAKGFEVFPRTRAPLQEAYHFTPAGDCILVGRPLQPEYAALRQRAIWLVAAGGAVLVCGLAGGMWVATRAIRPIEDISATAVKIAAGDLSQRIDTAGTDNELGHLAALLNATFARLETAFGQQARFTSDASHELRTPVTVILTQTQTALSRERPAADYRGALEACQRAAQRMRKLIESLLELARLDAGQEPLKQERFDLSRVVRDGVELVRPLAAEHGITIQCGLAPVECLGDAERLGQVVVNLLSNAIQFNRDQGEILISAASHERTAVLTVADHGPGIPAADLPHIFERFYRVDKSRSRLQGRSGLGLAICKAIVEAHGGSLEAASQEGQGSTFTVKLPIP